MRASYLESYGDPLDVVRVGEQPDPIVGPDTVLVRVRAAGVNPVDWKIVAGYLQGAIPHHLPMVPGWDVAGVVEAVGPAVTTVRAGDRVLAYDRQDHVQNGTFAELAAVPERAIATIPDGVDFTTAGALPLAGLTALQLLDALEVTAGDTVLVHAAAGGVGGFASQLARLRGATVVGTASEGNHAFLRERGVTPVTYGDGLVERVREVAPDGVDVVVDLVGGEALAATPQLLADGGRVASIVDADVVHDLGGTYVFVRGNGAELQSLVDLVASGDLAVEVAQTFDLEQAAEALEANKEGHTRGKVVVTHG
ncbi:NADP-dependent oxidoreductase [Solicola sp. PLA-1-18]|uniref:NADP-dependent oxidoreductase n=1 Tax=Solicola sp. PLA-1-18 TaxID=3380532 RepID=UPI003B784070